MRVAPLIAAAAAAGLFIGAAVVVAVAFYVLQGAVVLLDLIAATLDHTTML